MSVHIPKDGRWIVQYPNPEPPPRLKREYFGRGLEGEKRAMDCNEALGYRPGQKELLRLKWPDIDWDLQTILVHSARKGGIKSRMVPIHDNFLPILKGWLNEDLVNGKTANDHIITYNPIVII